MQYQVYNNCLGSSNEEKLQLKKLKIEKLMTEVKFGREELCAFKNIGSFPKFTKFGNLQFSENIVSLSLFREINELYSSICDAKNLLLKHKPHLATVVNIEDDCITPLEESKNLPMVFYKREDLTSIKAYKVRGALYQMSKIIEQNPSNRLRFVAASTGNHALGVLKAAEILNISNVTICISEDVIKFKREKLEKRIFELEKKGINANLVIKGKNFDETNIVAQRLAKMDENGFYIDPYNTHNAVAGQGTIGLELLSQLENKFSNTKMFDKLKNITVIVPIGGGGLISGITCALKLGINNFPKLKRLKLRIVGVKLEDLNSIYGDAIKVKAIGECNDKYIKMLVEKQILISDTDMKKGIDFLYNDIGTKIEGASAGTLKPIFKNIIVPSETNAVICILSGGNILTF